MNTFSYENTIKELLEKNNQKELENFFREKNITPSDYNNFENFIIYAIEHNTSNDIIEFLFQYRGNPNSNFEIRDNYQKKIPLFSAVGKNNFDLADILLEKYNANLDYYGIGGKYYNEPIIEYLYRYHLLDRKKLHYLRNKGCVASDSFLEKLISSDGKNAREEKDSDIKLYEYYFTCCTFTPDDILKFLNIYKRYQQNKNSLLPEDVARLNNNLKELIHDNKKRVQVSENLYQQAKINYNYEALRINFENDTSEESIVIKRMIDYDILNNALIYSKNFKFIMKLLKFRPFHYMCSDYEKIISSFFRRVSPKNEEQKTTVIKSFIQTFIKNSVSIYNKNNPLNQMSERGIPFRNLILNIAIREDCWSYVEWIGSSENGSELNSPDILGNYPIFVTIKEKNEDRWSGDTNDDIFKYLIHRGVDCNIRDSSQTSLLTLTIIRNNMSKLQWLLQERKDIVITERDASLCTPLETAINQNNKRAVQLLLSYADRHHLKLAINEKDIIGMNLIGKAIHQNDTSIVHALLNYANHQNIKIAMDEKCHSTYPLFIAITNKNFEMVIALVDYCHHHNISMTMKDINGNTPLTLSYKIGNSKIFNYLVAFFDINQKDDSGNTVLHYAMINKDATVTKQLLTMNANLSIKNKLNKSPLEVAISQKNYEILDTLIRFGNIDVNQKNSNGDSLLTGIIKSKKLTRKEKQNLMELLIKKGASLNILDKEGNTPLVYVLRNGNSDYSLYNLLLKNGAYYQSKSNTLNINKFIESKDYDLLEELYHHGFEMKSVRVESYSQLITDDKLDLFKKMICNTSSFDIQSKMMDNGNTLLHEAILKNKKNFVEFLLDYGADKTVKNRNGYNAYNYSKKCKSDLQIMDLLKD